MSSQGQIALECPTMEFTEESKPNIHVSVTTSGVSNSISKPLDHVINPENIDDDADNFFNDFPAGYRFRPHDHELVLHYLKNKISGLPLPRNRIFDVSFYQYNPEELAEQYKHYGEREWYFFTPRYKKYRNGTRPNRAAVGGYWKATGADKKIIYENGVIGYRQSLVYYYGKPPKGDKTNWTMHEFRVEDAAPPIRNKINDMRLDDWVLCRIYKKIEKPPKNREQNSTRRYDGPNDVAAIDGDCNSGTDSWENPRKQQATPPFFCNSYSAAQFPLYEESVPMPPRSDFLKGPQEELWKTPIPKSELADTFNLYDGMEGNLGSITDLPAVNLHINPSPARSGLSTSAITVEPKGPKLPQLQP